MSYTVILVKPSRPSNLGSICRILENFECSQLILVSNQVDLTHLEFQKTARHARNIIENALFVDTLPEALKHVTYSIGTTTRFSGDRNPKRIAFYPEEIPWNAGGDSPGIIFGPENYGLSNEDIYLCDFLVTIPTSERYRSMNLSHAVSILTYHAYRHLLIDQESSGQIILHTPATFQLKKQLLITFEEYVKRFCLSEKHRITNEVFRNFFGRSNITAREATTIIGALKAWKFHFKNLKEMKKPLE
ncbi:MAG: RNA methyltransferase [Candidatus Hodarchaeales archaeon]|jgi:TrmH family RNA methyltransferase